MTGHKVRDYDLLCCKAFLTLWAESPQSLLQEPLEMESKPKRSHCSQITRDLFPLANYSL